MTHDNSLSLAVLLAIALAACSGGGPPNAGSGSRPGSNGNSPSTEIQVDDGVMHRAAARKIFAQRCATCHGADGKGDGPVSRGLAVKPRSLKDPAWQASVTDDYLTQIIKHGGAAVGKSPIMPANADLHAKPKVVLALKDLVRGLAVE